MARATKTQTQVRREQIAEAAMALIGAEGLSGLSIARIADRVGIVPSAVYRHYKSKEEVLDTVLESIRSQLLANVEAVRAETPNALERLRLLFERHMQMLVDNPAFPHVLFAHFSQNDHVERWSSLHTTMCAYLTEVGQIIEGGKNAGAIRADTPVQTAAVMFIGLVLPAAMLHKLSGGEFDTAAHVEAAWPVYMRGLIAAGNALVPEIQSSKRQSRTTRANSILQEPQKQEQRRCEKK